MPMSLVTRQFKKASSSQGSLWFLNPDMSCVDVASVMRSRDAVRGPRLVMTFV